VRTAALIASGAIFGLGLAVSGIFSQEAVLAFLQLSDLGLLLTMAAGIAVAAPFYLLVPRRLARPLLGCGFERPARTVAGRHLLGGALFGVGWGISGVCPGAALASLGAGNWPMLAGLAGMLLGAYLEGRLEPTAGPRPGADPA
jgi:uncharacterized membrane protein YedE/YeeE